MIYDNIRPYEISLWTLQDGFITILKPYNLDNRGQIETPKITLKNDGTQEIKFSFPMYYYEGGGLVENPIWYTLKDGMLIENLRKLKVIFNKGEKEEQVFEFVITKVNETHTDGTLVCELEAEGLAFQELGKVGYKISLSQTDFEEEYKEWWEDERETAEPLMTINYWADKVFKNSDWTYSIQMDWSGFDGVVEVLDDEVREEKGLRRTDKIYEEEYVASWEDSGDRLVPHELVSFQEKARPIEVAKSNRYNITQTLAETFGVYCKYVYKYDDNYHIIGKECVFYNNFLNEKDGNIDINYPYDSSKIEREKDSTDVVTKMYVVPIEDDSTGSGLVTIADVSANKSREDYILNFDYLYEIGTISQEQYTAVADYERTMFNINTEIEPISSQIAKLQTDLIEYQAQKTISQEGQTQAKEQMTQAAELINSITSGSGYLYKNLDTPYRGTLLQNEDSTYYIKLTTEGIDPSYAYPLKGGDEEDTSGIRIWYKTDVNTFAEYTDAFDVEKDSNGNIVRLSKLVLKDGIYGEQKVYYITFAYLPQLYYQNIYNTFAEQLLDDEAAEKQAIAKIKQIESKLEELETKYDELLAQKELYIADFENMMGAALREGSWQADSYTDYGTNYDETITVGAISSSQYLNFIWDKEPFDEEQLNYEETFGNDGNAIEKEYYPAIKLSTENLVAIKDNLSNLSIVWDVSIPANALTKEQATIGSQVLFIFLSQNNTTIPALMLTSSLSSEDLVKIKGNGRIAVVSSTINEETFSVEVNENVLISNEEIEWIDYFNEDYIQVFPRIEIKTLLLKGSDENFFIKCDNENLEKFYDYSLLVRDEAYYATLTGEIMLKNANLYKTFEVSYSLSNAALALYLDALEVSKTNAFPQVSYEIDVSALSKDFIKTLYSQLNRVVNINDIELKFDNVRGYISELELNLDEPWEDRITVQNYKTKFEDLFSSIVASTEQMKSNSYSYGIAASAFTSSGSLRQDVIQNTINQVDLTYAFQSGSLTIDEVNGIWATSDVGVVAMRGGGIFCATQKDSYGNWLWNTGITPSGINANLLTAGQIDTNLIKIYSGDDLRFQLNSEGLYAYAPLSTGEANFDKYVVHNNNGLFLTENKINLVEISWDGLIIRNEEGEKVFFADDNGNLAITGTIAAKDGTIGGWLIKENGLYDERGIAGIVSYSTEESPYAMFWVYGENDNEFRVMSDGTAYMNNIIAKGFISAGSFVGNTSTDELDNQLREIDISILQGTTFFYNNLNYDGVLITDPNYLYFRVKTNALTVQELTESEYLFYYGEGETEDSVVWLPVPEKYIIWEQSYLTFKVKQDIMYMGDSTPHPLVYLKVEKEGKKRNVSLSGEIDYNTDYIYSSIIQLNAELNGVGKYITEMDPQSYTFVEDKNNGISYAETTTFSVVLTGFSREEALQGRWLIDGEDCGADMTLVASSAEAYSYESGGESAIVTDDELIIGEQMVEDGDNIVAADLSTNNGFEIFLEDLEDGTFKAYGVVSNELIKEGGSLRITFKLDSATRDSFCFKNRNGADSIIVSIKSSSGDTLTSGDINTELTAQVYFGSQLMNETEQYYYVWKKDDVAISTLKVKTVSQVENEDTTYSTIESINEYGYEDESFFLQKTIYITAADFGVKANYGCAIFTEKEEAQAEYLLNNEEQRE